MPKPATPQRNTDARHGTTYLWTTAIAALFALLCVTGVAMMTVYSPSVATAWASVFYIQDQMTTGWLVRGLHRFASDGLIVVCTGYVLHRILTRRYAPPRTRQWWLALGFLQLAMGAALTGALLNWDQKAYWGTTVRVNIASLVPVVGHELRTLILGGPELGQLTLTRFFTLHVAVLPLLFYLALRARHRDAAGLCKPCGEAPDRTRTEPHDGRIRVRAYRGAVRLMVVIGCFTAAIYSQYAMGDAHLHAPADASALDYPARPEWFNLFLFQWLKNFTTADAEVLGAIIIPGILSAMLTVLPWCPRLLTKRLGHALATAFVLSLLAATAYLTVTAVQDDMPPSEARLASVREKETQKITLTSRESRDLHAHEFQIKLKRAAFEANRAMALARLHGVPPEGPLTLMHSDPDVQGPRLFAAHCASCHRYDGHDGLGLTPGTPATSSDLAGFGTRDWIRAFLENPMANTHFGLMKKPDGSPAHTRMKKWTNGQREDASSDADREALRASFDAVSAYLADEAVQPGRLAANKETGDLLSRGRAYFMSTCNECHTYRGEQEGTRHAPEMFGYGSVAWIEGMIAQPDHETRYRNKGRQPAQMPRFETTITPEQITLLARWLHDSAAKSTSTAQD